MSRLAVGVLVVAVAGLSGCASPARVIRQDATSVVVAIPDNTNAWPFYYQDAAREAAAQYIADPLLSTSQRVKVGEQVTSASDTTHRDVGGQRSFGDVVTSTSTTAVSDRYEYHLEFRSTAPVRGPGAIAGTGPPPIPGGPAASLAPQGPVGDGTKPATIPPLLPVNAPASPVTNMPATGITQPGR